MCCHREQLTSLLLHSSIFLMFRPNYLPWSNSFFLKPMGDPWRCSAEQPRVSIRPQFPAFRCFFRAMSSPGGASEGGLDGLNFRVCVCVCFIFSDLIHQTKCGLSVSTTGVWIRQVSGSALSALMALQVRQVDPAI